MATYDFLTRIQKCGHLNTGLRTFGLNDMGVLARFKVTCERATKGPGASLSWPSFPFVDLFV